MSFNDFVEVANTSKILPAQRLPSFSKNNKWFFSFCVLKPQIDKWIYYADYTALDPQMQNTYLKTKRLNIKKSLQSKYFIAP